MEKHNIHEGHRRRLLERFRQDGFAHEHPHQVLEVLLTRVLPRKDTNPLAHALLERFSTLEQVLEASPAELQTVPGIGEKSAAYLASVRPRVSEMICAQYRQTGPLNRYQIAFLADWYLRRAGEIGLLYTDTAGCFRAFACIAPEKGEDGTWIPESLLQSRTPGWPDFENTENEEPEESGEPGAYLSLCIRDGELIPTDEIVRQIRLEAFVHGMILEEIYRIHGREPIPLLHPTRFADGENTYR